MRQKTLHRFSRLLPVTFHFRGFITGGRFSRNCLPRLSVDEGRYQSRSSLPRPVAGRSVPWPGREHQLPSPPAAPHTAYSAARWQCAAPSGLMEQEPGRLLVL